MLVPAIFRHAKTAPWEMRLRILPCCMTRQIRALESVITEVLLMGKVIQSSFQNRQNSPSGELYRSEGKVARKSLRLIGA